MEIIMFPAGAHLCPLDCFGFLLVKLFATLSSQIISVAKSEAA
jgi:hypothetical protein